MSELVPNENRYKVVAFEGKFKVKIVNIGGSTVGFADQVFDTEDAAKEYVTNLVDGKVSEPAPEVKPEFVPESPEVPVAPTEPEAPVAPESDSPTAPEAPTSPEVPVAPTE